ncbi:hypothetical protein A3Q56_01155 [Intoshia linei]|uniref:Bax inhibitor 1 n=1 Tax=Intoshia linei TaxID=1819745 RepID=A0A177BC92_9BILA|nr:hypothetical protein A3Q56_01155 [Intoshia linei]
MRRHETEESNVFWNYITSFDKLNLDTQHHLKKVYATLTISTLVAMLGSYAYIVSEFFRFGIIALIVGIASIVMLMTTKHTKNNVNIRTGYLMSFAFTSGISLGPIISIAMHIDETIVMKAFALTCIIFFCFSMASLKSASERKYLYLGGTILTLTSVVFSLSLANLFFGSMLLFDITLYAGLGMFLMYILYDTQLIVYKFDNGDDDYIKHSLDLFIDFVAIFRRLVIILAMNNEKKSKK